MISLRVKSISVATLGLAAIVANASTYEVSEILRGTWTETDLGGGNYSITYDMTFDSLLVGDPALFSASTTVTATGLMGPYVPDGFGDTVTASALGSGTFVKTLINGDTLFGFVSFAGRDHPASSGDSGLYFDTFTFVFLGGTGLFTGAFGLGFSNGENYYENSRFLPGSSGTSARRLEFSITTPLPAALPLLLTGIGLLGARKARRITVNSADVPPTANHFRYPYPGSV
jgi:hypothetical protein